MRRIFCAFAIRARGTSAMSLAAMWRRSTKAPPSDWYDYMKLQAQACQSPSLQRFYHAGLPAADTPLSELPLLALDFETTGLDPHRDEIVSIGMVPFTLAGIRPAAGYYQVVKPSRALNEQSITFHRITHSQVAEAPSLDEVLDEVIDLLAGSAVVVHYRHIERPFLDLAALRLRGEHCLFPVIDTMAIEARWQHQGWRRQLQHWLGVSPASIRLDDSRRRYGLPTYSAHHAKVDAVATAELFLAQVARHYTPQTPIARLWD